ncbi:MAG: biotin/lipoyl-binding protein, partial [Planctomycetota bacterium]|nr:biotin/lipoyl-binding protein [Planctomycetota bacterium]
MSVGLQAPGREADRELPRPPAPRWLWWSIAATGLATLCCLVAVLAIPLEERLPLVGIVEDGDSLLIHAPREGRIARLCVADGQQVTAGEPLLALEDAAWRQEAEQARAALAEAEAALAAALAEQACALPQELLLAASEATALAVVVAERQALWERLRQGGEGAVSAWELAREQLALREAERALTRARAAQALIDGPWGEGQRAAAAARAQLAAARQRAAAARLAHAEAELAACL